jgi:hypothetical protein
VTGGDEQKESALVLRVKGSCGANDCSFFAILYRIMRVKKNEKWE